MEQILNIQAIAMNPDVRGGRPYIMGTTLTIADLVEVAQLHNLTAEQLSEHFQLDLAAIYAALSYYHAHQSEIDSSIHERQQVAEEFKEKRVGSRHKPLFG